MWTINHATYLELLRKKGGFLCREETLEEIFSPWFEVEYDYPFPLLCKTLGAYSHLFSWKFHLLPQYKTPRKSRCKKISINARKENHVPFSSSFRKSVEPKVGEELSTWRLHSVLQLLQQRQNEKAVKQELYYHSWKIIDHVMRSRNSKKLLCPIFTVWQKKNLPRVLWKYDF